MLAAPTTNDTRVTTRAWTDLAGGARAMAPWLIGVAPFGLVIGVSAAHAHIPLLAGWLTAPLIFSGSAQVATIGLLAAGAAPAVVALAALAINLRLVLYSATMAANWRGTTRRWQALAAYLLVEPTLAVGVAGYEALEDRRRAHLHYLGGGITLWVAWLAAVTIGATAGAGVPAVLHLELVVPLFLTGEVVHRVRDWKTTQAVAVAAIAAVMLASMPLHLGPIVSITGGVAAGMYAERRTGRS